MRVVAVVFKVVSAAIATVVTIAIEAVTTFFTLYDAFPHSEAGRTTASQASYQS